MQSKCFTASLSEGSWGGSLISVEDTAHIRPLKTVLSGNNSPMSGLGVVIGVQFFFVVFSPVEYCPFPCFILKPGPHSR